MTLLAKWKVFPLLQIQVEVSYSMAFTGKGKSWLGLGPKLVPVLLFYQSDIYWSFWDFRLCKVMYKHPWLLVRSATSTSKQSKSVTTCYPSNISTRTRLKITFFF